MSFLYNNSRVLVVPCTPLTSRGTEDAETVSVNPKFCGRLSAEGRFGLCISPVVTASTFKGPSLICWAIPDSRTEGVSVPWAWFKDHSRIFSKSSTGTCHVSISVVQPAPVSEVLITALSHRAFEFSQTKKSALEDAFTHNSPILRQYSTYTIPYRQLESLGWGDINTGELEYRLDMVSPFAQGYAQKGSTRFIITFSDSIPAENRHALACESDDETDSAMFEIDEDFLAIGCRHPNLPLSLIDANTSTTTIHALTREPHFQARPLPEESKEYQDDHALYLHVADFGRIGLLNGDWAIIHPSDINQRRLVRVYSCDTSTTHPIGTIMGSPILLSNISRDFDYMAQQFTLSTSPFGSIEPNMPIARSVTIARVTTPISTDRSYQTLSFHALKHYFEGKKRLVKEGDLIALKIDTDLAWRITDRDTKSDIGSTPQEDDEVAVSVYPCIPPRTNELVFFKVTNIEHVAVSNGIDESHDIAYESAAGELGFWVEPTVTRIVQAGSEHSRIPDIEAFISFGDQSARSLLTTISKQPAALLGFDSPYNQLYSLLSATFAERAVDYNLDLSVLLQGVRGTGKSTVACWVAQCLGFNFLEINCYNLLGESDMKTEGVLRARFDKAMHCAPCILILRQIDALVQTTQVLESGKDPAVIVALKECIESTRDSWRTAAFPVIVIGTTSEPSRVPSSILALFKHQISFEAPNEAERYEILNALLKGTALAPDVSLAFIATQSAALVAADLVGLIVRARQVSLESTANHSNNWNPVELDQTGMPLTARDFDVALNKARASYSDTIGAPKIPTVTWDDVGGLAHVKADILDTIQLPLEHPELFADGLKKRSGILLYGPPGTGKTLLAKAVATSCSLNFFSVKGPELLNMYIGESEANVRRVFQRARDAKPCVIFFDELDSVAPKRGNHGDSGGVMDRIVSQLLAELDGMSSGNAGADVFVIGATNRPDLLDPALLRPGRFDRMLYLGVSDTHEAQFNILEALTRKFRLHPDLDLRHVAEDCPFNYTGADFYALCSDAMLRAMSRKAEELEDKIEKLNAAPEPHARLFPLTPQYYLAEVAAPADIEVLVTKEDFDIALKNLVPSVSQSEMEHYSRVQKRFSQQSVD